MRHHAFGDRFGGGLSGGLAHRDGVSSDAVAGVGKEIAADTTPRHQQAIDIGCDKCRIGDVVLSNAARSERFDAFRISRELKRVHVDRKLRPADGLGMPQPAGDVVTCDCVPALHSAGFSNTDLFSSRNNRQILPHSAQTS